MIINAETAPDILRLLKGPLENLVTQDIQLDIDREKIVQYANARRNDLYYHGKQYLYPVRTDGQVVDWSATTGNAISRAPDDASRTYDYVMNFIRGDGDKAIAVLAQKPPGIKGQPDRPDDDDGHRRARMADLLAAALRSHWRLDELMRSLAHSLWTYGTTFLYTPFVANAARYGTTEEPIFEIQDVPAEPYLQCRSCGAQSPLSPEATCLGCGALLSDADVVSPEPLRIPLLKGMKSYPNGSVEAILATIFEVTTPFHVKNLSECPWLWYEFEMHKGALMAVYPELREWRSEEGSSEIGSASGAGRMARDMASSPSKSIYPRKNRWLYSRYWIRPSMYELLGGATGDQVRNTLYQHFPMGAKLTMVNNRLIRINGERMDEVWAAIKPRSGQYLYADPLCEDYIGPQDIINDMYNIMVQTAERAIPFTLYDPMVLDNSMMSKQRATPMEMIPAKAGIGGHLRDSLFTPPVAQMQPEVVRLAETSRDGGRQLVGVLPAMFGGDEGHEQTAREAEMKRNQALMQLNTSWNYIRNGLSIAFENAAMQFAKHSGGRLFVTRGANMPAEVIEMPNVEELALGGWHYEAEEAMPMTWGQRTDRMWSLLEGDKQPAWGILGIDNPDNILTLQETMGMPNWKVPFLDALYKARDTIRLLSQGAPIQSMGPMGEPMMLPSIPVDEFEDDHVFCAKVVQNWAQTEKARELRLSNPEGYANVIAWGKQHFMMAQPPMPPPLPNSGKPADESAPSSDPALAAPPPAPPPAPADMGAAPPMIQ